MNILFLSGEFPPLTGFGGIGSYVSVIARALADRGHKVHVLSCLPHQVRDDQVCDGVIVHRRGLVRIRGLRHVFRSFEVQHRFLIAASCLVEVGRMREEFDVIEAPDWMAEGLFLAMKRRPPVVSHLHTPLKLATAYNGDTISKGVLRGDRLERFAVRASAAITCPSRLLAEELESHRWLPKKPISIVANPIDLSKWEARVASGEAPPTVIVTGTIRTRKGQDLLVEAAGILQGDVPEIRLLCVGKSFVEQGADYSGRLARRASELGLDCRFVDHVDRDQLPRIYDGARLAALPSRFENLSMAGLEAMAAGRPLVCSSNTGNAELVGTLGGGAVFVDGCVEDLAAKMKPFLVDADLATKTGTDAVALVQKYYSAGKIAIEREQVYERILRPKGR